MAIENSKQAAALVDETVDRILVDSYRRTCRKSQTGGGVPRPSAMFQSLLRTSEEVSLAQHRSNATHLPH